MILDLLGVDREQTWADPAPSPDSQSAGALAPMSPSRSARAAMPFRNSAAKLPSTSSPTPRGARRPAAVTATLSVVRGLPPSEGAAVVTWSIRPENQSRARSGEPSIVTKA